MKKENKEISENPISWASKERDKYWKKKIQNAQRRLKELEDNCRNCGTHIPNHRGKGTTMCSKKCVNDWDWKSVKQRKEIKKTRIDKIFKEEFGEKLTNGKQS